MAGVFPKTSVRVNPVMVSSCSFAYIISPVGAVIKISVSFPSRIELIVPQRVHLISIVAVSSACLPRSLAQLRQRSSYWAVVWSCSEVGDNSIKRGAQNRLGCFELLELLYLSKIYLV